MYDVIVSDVCGNAVRLVVSLNYTFKFNTIFYLRIEDLCILALREALACLS